MRVFVSSGKRAVVLPIASYSSVIENAMSWYRPLSVASRVATSSMIPGIVISPLGLTREFIKYIKSVIGS